MTAAIAVVGAGAVTALGGIAGVGPGADPDRPPGPGRALLAGTRAIALSRSLAGFTPVPPAAEIATIPAPASQDEKLARRLMSRSALLGHLAARSAIASAGWDGPAGGQADDPASCADVGLFMGVGASGGSIAELEAMLAASAPDRDPEEEDARAAAQTAAPAFSVERFGTRGLRACNPLFAFQLMNNFAMCHAAILAGLRGPNAALFSRGQGTVVALSEAMAAIAGGDCTRALAGGADSAVHPVTWAELVRDGHAGEGFVPGEGAAVLALAAARPPDVLPDVLADFRPLAYPLAYIERCVHRPVRAGRLDEAWARALGHAERDAAPPDLVLLAAWGPPARDPLQRWLADALPGATMVDVTAGVGEALAATPAIAWVAAVELLATGCFARALVVTAGIDGALGAVTFARSS